MTQSALLAHKNNWPRLAQILYKNKEYPITKPVGGDKKGIALTVKKKKKQQQD